MSATEVPPVGVLKKQLKKIIRKASRAGSLLGKRLFWETTPFLGTFLNILSAIL